MMTKERLTDFGIETSKRTDPIVSILTLRSSNDRI